MAEKSGYLGIDWGASDVGVSFADAETRIAFAHSTLKNDKTLLDRIGEIIVEKEIGTVVIGIPSHVNRPNVSYEGERLGETLQKLFPVRVVFQDEMFTTRMAQANLKERGIRHIARFDDAEAAKIILQEWLDRTKENEKSP